MRVIIPAAGIGKRLRPHTYSKPKPLLPVAGKTVLAHILDPVVTLEPDEVIMVVGYRGDAIRSYVESNYSFSTRFVQQDALLGLGYAVKLALEKIDGGPVLIILGDTVVDCNLQQFIEAGEAVLGLCPVDDPTRFGIAEVADGYVVGLEEKPRQPKSDLALIGLYYLADSAGLKKALDELVRTGKTTSGEVQLTDALALMIAGGTRFAASEVSGWFDCGKKETMLETNRRLLAGAESPIEEIPGSTLLPPVHIAEDARIVNSVIGPNVSVSPGTVIERSILRDCIVGSRSKIVDMVLKDSLVGDDVTLEGNARVLNVGDSGAMEGGS
jgi:glucose-1-phosphate thymidylyltransferase